MNSRIFILFFICGLLVVGQATSSTQYVRNNEKARFGSLYVDGKPVVELGETFFNVGGKRYSSVDGSLKLINTSTTDGRDAFGSNVKKENVYQAGDTMVATSERSYTAAQTIVFEQQFLNETKDTSIWDPEAITSGFPCFKFNGKGFGYLSYGGSMAGNDHKSIGKLDKSAKLNDGTDGGPLVIFNKKGVAIVVSVMSEFMISSPWFDKKNQQFCYGIMGSVLNIPEGFSMKTIVHWGTKGINNAMVTWGELMKRYYNRHIAHRHADLTLNYLGFWTDGGAYYFYNTEPNKTYEQTILEVKAYADKVNLPYKYVQYDSWWYYKDTTSHQDVTKWEPMPSVFPNGLRYMWDQTGWPASCHNRQWSHLTPYAKKNGGKYDFIVDADIAIPQDPAFWEYLFDTAKRWGLITYEQDHLDQQFRDTNETRTDVYVARNWLLQMGEAARRNGLTIQYCMSYPRHILQSLEIPVVTHARVSGDYRPGQDQWKIGLSSIFADAIGIAPFKDNFFTSSEYEPGNTYKMRETQPDLNAAVATLSTAPVAPSDKVGYTNVSMLMKCCNTYGKILKPNMPAKAIDAQILQTAFQDGSGPQGEVWTTHSRVSVWTFGIVLAADLKTDYKLTPSKAGFVDVTYGQPMQYYCADWVGTTRMPMAFDMNHPIALSNCGITNFCLYYTSPVFTFQKKEVILIGDVTKWVPMSSRRVRGIIEDGEDIQIFLLGQERESLDFWLVVDGKWVKIACMMDDAGTATLSLVNNSCR